MREFQVQREVLTQNRRWRTDLPEERAWVLIEALSADRADGTVSETAHKVALQAGLELRGDCSAC